MERQRKGFTMNMLTASDGHQFDCWIEHAQAPRRGGLVILQEIFGVTDQLKRLGSRYARLGYDIAIPALFDRQQRGAVIPFDKGTPGRDMMLAADLSHTMADVAAAVQTLAERGSKVAAMGFCWGGGLALRAAQTLPISGAVVFYGTRLPQYLNAPLKVPVIAHYGVRDEHVPKEMLDQAIAYFPDMEIHMYETGHAFANDARPTFYDKASAELAHERSEAFLARVLG